MNNRIHLSKGLKSLVFLIQLFFISFGGYAQVTQLWTDYNGFWTSSASSISTTEPDNSHNLLAFRFNGVNYSTGVNDAILTGNGVSFTTGNWRGLPLTSIAAGSCPHLISDSYLIMLAQLADGVNNGGSTPSPFPVPVGGCATGATLAGFLTRGVNGLDLGSGLANIPANTTLSFTFSSNGITQATIADGVPDILITQILAPGGTQDVLRIVDAGGNIVGNQILINQNNTTVVGNYRADIYFRNGTIVNGAFGGIVPNAQRPIRMLAFQLSDFGVNASNYTQAVKLEWVAGGSSDPAFFAFNEPSISLATNLVITSQPTVYSSGQAMSSGFTVMVEDNQGTPVIAAGTQITASIASGSGSLSGTLTATTDANGVATFTNLIITGSGVHQISFSSSSLDPVISTPIVDCCNWTGTTNSDWNNSGNWSAGVPASGQNAVIPVVSSSNYPILEVNPNLANLTVEAGASLTIPGNQNIIVSGTLVNNGSITIQEGGALLQTVGSTLSGAGTFSVKRNLPTANRFHYIGSPVQNIGAASFGIVPASVNGSNGSQLIPQVSCNVNALEAGSPWANLLELRENATLINNCSQSLWHIKSSGTLTDGRGYAAMAYGAGSSQNLSFDGTVNNGTVTYGGLGNSGPVSPTPPALIDPVSGPIYRGWHLVSNPYPSPITFGSGNASLTGLGFDAQVQVWNSASNSWIPSVSNTVLPVAQGFQIRNSGTSTLNFTTTNAMRTATSAIFYDVPWEQYLTVTLENDSQSMQTVVFFHEEATDGYDSQLEANRLFGGADVPVIYTLAGNESEKMAFNGYAPINSEPKSVVLGVYDGGMPGNFILRFQDLNTLTNTSVVLEDKKLNTFTPINEGDEYPFTTVDGDERNRFMIHFNMLDVSGLDHLSQSIFAAFPNPADDLINVRFTDINQGYFLQLSDLTGKVLYSCNTESYTSEFQLSTESLAPGVYLLKASSAKGKVQVVKIIKK